jgi:hypothetical protein
LCRSWNIKLSAVTQLSGFVFWLVHVAWVVLAHSPLTANLKGIASTLDTDTGLPHMLKSHYLNKLISNLLVSYFIKLSTFDSRNFIAFDEIKNYIEGVLRR